MLNTSGSAHFLAIRKERNGTQHKCKSRGVGFSGGGHHTRRAHRQSWDHQDHQDHIYLHGRGRADSHVYVLFVKAAVNSEKAHLVLSKSTKKPNREGSDKPCSTASYSFRQETIPRVARDRKKVLGTAQNKA